MFINRPLIHGIAKRKENSTHTSKYESKSHLRIKTVPSRSKNIINSSQIKRDLSRLVVNDIQNVQGNIIGVKDVKQMIDNDLQTLISRILDFEAQTQSEDLILTASFLQKYGPKNKSQNSTLEGISYKQQQKAFIQCKEVLQYKDKQQQNIHLKTIKQKTLLFYELEQTKQQLQNLKGQILEEHKKIKFEGSRLQQQSKILAKKILAKRQVIEQIQAQKKKITSMNQKIYASKQQSLKQKNQFIQIQAQEIRLTKQIQDLTNEETQYQEGSSQNAYFMKLQKLKQKLLQIRNKGEQQIQQFIQQKIIKISKILAKNDSKMVQIQQLDAQLDQQQAIIKMLQKKVNQHEQQQQLQSSQTYQKYKKKYNSVYLNKTNPSDDDGSTTQQRQINHWQNYKVYLQKILKNEKKLQHNQIKSSQHTSISQTNYEGFNKEYEKKSTPKKIVKKYPVVSHQQQNLSQKPVRNKTDFNEQKINKNKKLSSSEVKINNEKALSLPKLIKIQGKLQDKDKIKNQLTKFTNQQFDQGVQYQTVRTSQADQDQIIEVQFKGTKNKKGVPENIVRSR